MFFLPHIQAIWQILQIFLHLLSPFLAFNGLLPVLDTLRPCHGNRSLRTMYRFDKARSTMKKLVFFARPFLRYSSRAVMASMVLLVSRAKKPNRRFSLATTSSLTVTLISRLGAVLMSKYLLYQVSCSGTLLPDYSSFLRAISRRSKAFSSSAALSG